MHLNNQLKKSSAELYILLTSGGFKSNAQPPEKNVVHSTSKKRTLAKNDCPEKVAIWHLEKFGTKQCHAYQCVALYS